MMNYSIRNEKLTLVIASKAGEFRSIKDAQGREYLWQGDEATWSDRGPNLFPYIGRMTDKSYRYKGDVYHMDIHGILPYAEMKLVEQRSDSLTLRLESSEETKRQYPFDFVLDITWTLDEETITICYQVQNTGDRKMHFGIGGHPGFRVPVETGLAFEDYHIDFGENARPRRILFSEDCFVLEEDEALELEEGRYLNLRHNLFDQDAIVLKEMPKTVTLGTGKSGKMIRVAFPDMEFLGIWHWPHVEVDYVCIEPWSSLPSRKDVVEDLEKQKDLLSLEPGSTYTNTWSITITEK